MSAGTAFPFRISGGRVARTADVEKVAENLRHLLQTRLGERVLRRDYGGGVHHRLQEPNDSALRALARHEIELAIRTHLPDVRLLGPVQLTHDGGDVTVSFDYAPDQRVTFVLGRQA